MKRRRVNRPESEDDNRESELPRTSESNEDASNTNESSRSSTIEDDAEFVNSSSDTEEESEILENESAGNDSVDSSRVRANRVVQPGGKGEINLIHDFGEVLVRMPNGGVVQGDHVKCRCGKIVIANSQAIKKHTHTIVHRNRMSDISRQTNGIAEYFRPSANSRSASENGADVVKFALKYNICMSVMHSLVRDTGFCMFMQSKVPAMFPASNSTLYNRARMEFVEARVRLRRILVDYPAFSIAIDETKQADMNPLIGIIAKTYRETLLVDIVCAKDLSLTAETYLSILSKFLDGSYYSESLASNSPNIIPLPRKNVIQLMSDNCPTMNAMKRDAKDKLALSSKFFQGNCISHSLNLVEDHMFKVFGNVLKLVNDLHKVFWGSGDLHSRRSALLNFEVPAGTNSEVPPETIDRILDVELTILRSKTTRWHARVNSLEVIVRRRKFLLLFLTSAAFNESNSAAVGRAITLLNNEQVIFEANALAILLGRLKDWIECSQGRGHTFTGEHVDQIETNIARLNEIKSTSIDDLIIPGYLLSPFLVEESWKDIPDLNSARNNSENRLLNPHIFGLNNCKIIYHNICSLLGKELECPNIKACCKLSKMIEYFVPSRVLKIKLETRNAAVNATEGYFTFRIIGGDELVNTIDNYFQFRGDGSASAKFYSSAHTDFCDYLEYLERLSEDARKKIDYVSFWKPTGHGGKSYVILAQIARIVLAVTISNGPMESAFSMWRNIDTPRRQAASEDLSFAYFFSYFNKP